MKMKLHEDRKQYNHKANQWKAIKITISKIKLAEEKITKSIDNRLLAVIVKKNHDIKM